MNVNEQKKRKSNHNQIIENEKKKLKSQKKEEIENKVLKDEKEKKIEEDIDFNEDIVDKNGESSDFFQQNEFIIETTPRSMNKIEEKIVEKKEKEEIIKEDEKEIEENKTV
jgi:hypothetical protein